jgi:hypothetical protein
VTAGAPENWSELALALGYYDQSHLVCNVHQFTGTTPTEARAMLAESPDPARTPGEFFQDWCRLDLVGCLTDVGFPSGRLDLSNQEVRPMAKKDTATVIPTLRYRDAATATE